MATRFLDGVPKFSKFYKINQSQEENNKVLKWVCLSGLHNDYPIWSTKFEAFALNKGLFGTLTDDFPRNPPERLSDLAQMRNRLLTTTPINDIERRKTTLWCYLKMELDSTNLMLERHDCVDNKGLDTAHGRFSKKDSPATKP